MQAISALVFRSVAGVVFLLSSFHVFAWGKDGHAIVATLAQAQLSPKARAEVDKLLALEPGATLVNIASWG